MSDIDWNNVNIEQTRKLLRTAWEALNKDLALIGRNDAVRSLALARTEMETAELWLGRAACEWNVATDPAASRAEPAGGRG